MSTPYVAPPEVVTLALSERRKALREKVGLLAERRGETAVRTADVKAMKAVQVVVLAPLVNLLKTAEAEQDIIEKEVRGLALEIHTLDPSDAKPGPGVTIEQGSVLKYDADKAFAFAQAKGMFVLPPRLDTDAFESFLKNTPADAHGFTAFALTKEPKVMLASDLGKALASADLTASAR